MGSRHNCFETRGLAPARCLSCAAWLVLFIVSFGAPVSAQEVPFRVEYLTIKEGLSSNRVWDFCEDDQGFIWIATGYGLNRFDGYTCTVYGQLIVDNVFVDRKGRFWLSDVAGSSYRFDQATARFTHYPILGSRHSVGYTDSHEARWVGTWGNGLGRYVDSMDSYVMYTSDPKGQHRIASDTIYSIGEDNRGRLLVGTKNGLAVYDRERDTFDQWASGPNSQINFIMEDRKGTLWLSTEAGLCEASLEKGSFRVYRNIDDRWSTLRTLLEDSKGDFWVCSLGGVSRFNRETGRFQNFDSYLPENFSRGTAFPRYILVEDSSGNVWAGVHNILARFDRAKKDMVLISFSSETSQANRTINWAREVTTQIYVDKAGTLWFGRFDGAARIVKTQKSFVEFSFDDLSPAVLSMREDRDGILWFGKDDGLLGYDKKTGARIRYTWDPRNPRTIGGNVIQNIVEGRANTLWLAIAKMGINRFHKSSGLSIRYIHDPDKSGSLPYDNIGALFLDHEGTLWAGPEGGLLSRLNPESGTFINVLVDPVRRADISVIFEDRSSTLWMGGDGLRAFNPKAGTWESVSPRPVGPFEFEQ